MTELVQDEQLVFNNFLTLNFTYVEERLKKNFEIIAGKIAKLETLLSLEDRVKTLERESKFTTMKLENMALRLPDAATTVSEHDVRSICAEKIQQLMNQGHQNIKTTKLFADIKDAIDKSSSSLTVSRKDPKKLVSEDIRRADKNTAGDTQNNNEQTEDLSSSLKISKQLLSKHLTKDEMGLVDRILKQQKSPEQLLVQLAVRMDHFERNYEETRISKGVLDIVNKDFDKFETVEQRFDKYEKKNKTARETVSLSRDKDSFSQNLLKESRKMIGNRKVINTEELGNPPSLTQLPDTRGETRTDMREVRPIPEQDAEIQKMTNPQGYSKRNKSLSKLTMPEKTEKKLRLDDPKDLNYIIKEIESRLELKVSKEVFMNFVQDFEERLQQVRYSKSQVTTTYSIFAAYFSGIRQNEALQFKRYYNSLENRLQAIIGFLQQSQEEQDPLVTKKKWACMSCDKPLSTFSAKLGPHMNWDVLAPKKTSPTKAGAFGQTVMLANKVKSIMQLRKGEDE